MCPRVLFSRLVLYICWVPAVYIILLAQFVLNHWSPIFTVWLVTKYVPLPLLQIFASHITVSLIIDLMPRIEMRICNNKTERVGC